MRTTRPRADEASRNAVKKSKAKVQARPIPTEKKLREMGLHKWSSKRFPDLKG